MGSSENAEPVEDGTTDFNGGQDAYHEPDAIGENFYWKGVNVSTRRGVLRPRDGSDFVDTSVEEGTFSIGNGRTRTLEAIFRSGKYQAFIPFFSHGEYSYVVVISGLVFSFSPRTRRIILLSKDITVNQYSARINWSYAGNYLVLFDYPNYPVIVSGTDIFRSNPNNMVNGQLQPQVPISTVGTFNQNRLAVGNAGSEFILGDPVGNPLTPEAPITFTEVLGPAAVYPGQSFSLGTNLTNEPITAMGFLQAVDQNTGIGPLFVATENSMYWYRTDLPRDQWVNPNSTQPFGSLLLFNAGIAGPRAFVNVNSDLFFLSGAGQVHSLTTARQNAKEWGNTPISREVENWLKYWDESLKQFSFLQYFNNRVYVSANPFRTQALTREGDPIVDFAFGGVVPLELDNLNTLQVKIPPSWAGLWTKPFYPMDMVISNKRCFSIGKYKGQNHIFEITPNKTYDVLENGRVQRVRSIVYTREYFGQSRFLLKKEKSLYMPIQDIEGELEAKIERRPSHSNLFKLWRNWKYSAPITQCKCKGLRFPLGLVAHRVRDLIFGAPNDNEQCIGKFSYELFLKIQFKLTLIARYWQIEELKVVGVSAPSEDLNTSCEYEGNFDIPYECDNDWQIYKDDLCNLQ